MPWYRPTRICHVTSGSEFGGEREMGNLVSGNIRQTFLQFEYGQGSPDNVVYGKGANISRKISKSIYAVMEFRTYFTLSS